MDCWCRSLSATGGLNLLHGESSYCRPRPILDFRHVLAVLINVALVLDEFVLQLLLEVYAAAAGLLQAIDGVDHQMKTIEIVQDRHIESGGDRALLLVAAD